MPEFWKFLMQYIVQGHYVNYWAVIGTEAYLEHCQALKTGVFSDKIRGRARYKHPN